MRIIAGSLKGRRLAGFNRNLPLRPMTDRVKECLFGVLSPFLHKDFRFLDLFSGTGNLALEALSRGAGEAHAVESHPRSVEIIHKNRRILPCPKRLLVHKQDVFSFMKASRLPGFDVITADPPFPLKAGHSLLQELSHSRLFARPAFIALEVSKKEPLEREYPSFKLFSQKDFGDKKLWFYRTEESASRRTGKL